MKMLVIGQSFYSIKHTMNYGRYQGYVNQVILGLLKNLLRTCPIAIQYTV